METQFLNEVSPTYMVTCLEKAFEKLHAEPFLYHSGMPRIGDDNTSPMCPLAWAGYVYNENLDREAGEEKMFCIAGEVFQVFTGIPDQRKADVVFSDEMTRLNTDWLRHPTPRVIRIAELNISRILGRLNNEWVFAA